MLEKGLKAFVSFVRGYKEHHCSYIFRFIDMLNYFCCLHIYIYISLSLSLSLSNVYLFLINLQMEKPRNRKVSNGIWTLVSSFNV